MVANMPHDQYSAGGAQDARGIWCSLSTRHTCKIDKKTFIDLYLFILLLFESFI